MPRTYGKAKQTRLSFAPLPSSSQNTDKSLDTPQKDRLATLRYDHPSLSIPRKGPSLKHRLTRGKQTPAPPSKLSSEGSSSSEAEQNPRTPRQAQALNPSPKVIALDEDEDSDLEIQHSARKTRLRLGKRRRSSTPPKLSDSSAEKQSIRSSNGGDEDTLRVSHRKLRRGAARKQPIVVEDDSDTSEEPVRSSPIKKRKRNTDAHIPQTPRRYSEQEQLDLEEDLEDLQESVVKDTRTRGRLAHSARAQRQLHLEALRRRRAGGREVHEAESDHESESSNDNSSEDESETEPEKNIQQPVFRRSDSDVESSIADDEDLDRYEDDFVLEDDDGELGVPSSMVDMPFEFTRHAYKQLKEYFQDAVEWMVNNQLNPAFPRSDPLYEVAFGKLEDEVKGRTGSQLLSTVWSVEFRRALLARPQIEITQYPIIDNHPCDACNRSGHPASSDMKLYGKPYSLETLEPLSGEESDEDDEDGVERDRDGYSLPDQEKRFYLGRHCKNKASLAHTLTHWRFHLNEWVVDYLRRMGHLEDDKVLERSHWSQKRKSRYASEVMGSMVDSGEVKKLWRDFHITLRSARESTTIG